MENDLGQTVKSGDSIRLAGKAKNVDPFLGGAQIMGSDNIIPIPEGAGVLRLKSDEVRFFSKGISSKKPKSNNGYSSIPEGAKKVQFPTYEKHAYNIDYGEPVFY